MFSGRSMMYNRKRSGPSTEHWGTPEVTFTSSDDSPSSTKVWVRPIRNDWIQFKVLPFTPKQENLYKSFRWFSLSRALLKSKSIKSVCFPKDSCLPKSSTNWINWVSHERFSRNPCWSSYRILCLFRCLERLEAIMCSITLHKIHVKEMGL